jgi:death-on-curing protein
VTDFLTFEDALEVIDQLGVGPVKDAGLLASALARPQTTLFGQDAYPTVVEKAAALMHSLARNHALVDGNNRLAWVLTRTFLLLNNHDLRMDTDSAEAIIVKVAAGDLDARELASELRGQISAHS